MINDQYINKCYSGVGSRECPEDVQLVMTNIASILYNKGYTLRSGAANGADRAFQAGCPDPTKRHIYLPWKEFNGDDSPLYGVCPKALEIASKIHPAWQNCREKARLLHARNVYQVLGRDLNNPSKFLICWTEKGEERGGTRTAIKLAQKYDIPVLNFGSIQSKSYMDAFELFLIKYQLLEDN